MSLDIDTQILGSSELSATVEQTWTMRALDGALHVPYLDPQSTNANPENGQLATSPGGGTWNVIATCSGVTHAFDVAKTSAGLFLFGANETDDQAVIWRSQDDGATWTVSLTVDAPDGAPPLAARFYAAAQFGDTIVALFHDDTTDRAFQWDGAAWAEVDSPGKITDVPCTFTLNGTAFGIGIVTSKDLAYVQAPTAPVVVVQEADAVHVATIAASLPNVAIYDAATDGTNLYLLDETGPVWRGETTGTWTDVLTVDDPTVRSIAVADGFLYFGTTDSRILRTPIPT